MSVYVCCQDDSPVTVFHEEKNAVEWVKDKVFTELYLKRDWEHLFFDMTDDEIMDEGSDNDIYYLIIEYGDEEEHHCCGGSCCNCKQEHKEISYFDEMVDFLKNPCPDYNDTFDWLGVLEKPKQEKSNKLSFKKLNG